MTDSNERWADSSEKATESYGDIKDSTTLGRGSDASSSDPCLKCQPVPIEVVQHQLRDISFSFNADSPILEAVVAKYPLSANGRPAKMGKAAHAFLKRRAGVAQEILGEVFTMHPPLRNA